MSEKAKSPAESKSEHPNKLIAIWKREWPQVKEHPTACACCFLLGCALIVSLYSIFLIPGKDSTIQSLQTRLGNQPSESPKILLQENGAPKLTESRTQWHLRIRSVEVVSKSTNDHPQSVPFRIIAQVNSQNYSFPSTQLCFSGEVSARGESVPLPIEQREYLVQFVRQDINRNFLRTSITNSFILKPGGQTDSFAVKDLPTIGTNVVVNQDLRTGVDTGITRIIYEIADH